jgi:hypothetical protein
MPVAKVARFRRGRLPGPAGYRSRFALRICESRASERVLSSIGTGAGFGRLPVVVKLPPHTAVNVSASGYDVEAGTPTSGVL